MEYSPRKLEDKNERKNINVNTCIPFYQGLHIGKTCGFWKICDSGIDTQRS